MRKFEMEPEMEYIAKERLEKFLKNLPPAEQIEIKGTFDILEGCQCPCHRGRKTFHIVPCHPEGYPEIKTLIHD